MIRYFLGRGDRAGSAVIIEGLENVTCSNPPPTVQLSTLYMKTYCTACKREGFIGPKGPRHPGTGPNGKPWALSGDINVCGCNPPPVFYAVRNMRMTFTSEELGRMSAPLASAHMRQHEDGSMKAEHADRYTLIDQTSGKPIVNTAYAIKRVSGVIEHGTTDAAGHTHLLSVVAQAEAVEIYLEA